MRRRPPPLKKIRSCVRPGVCEMRARPLRPVSALMRLDLPTLERPAKAVSMPSARGSDSGELAAQKKSHSPANNLWPVSISAEVKSVMAASYNGQAPACPGPPDPGRTLAHKRDG